MQSNVPSELYVTAGTFSGSVNGSLTVAWKAAVAIRNGLSSFACSRFLTACTNAIESYLMLTFQTGNSKDTGNVRMRAHGIASHTKLTSFASLPISMTRISHLRISRLQRESVASHVPTFQQLQHSHWNISGHQQCQIC